MDPTHVMSFAGAGGIVESITLCGVEPGHVEQLSVHKGQLEIVYEHTHVDDETGARISAGQALAMRSAMAGRAGMRIEFLEGGGLWSAGAPIVLSAWLAPGQLSKLQVVVTYRPDR